MTTLQRALDTAEPHRFTLRDLRAMTQIGILGDERLELIDGLPLAPPSEDLKHARLRMRLVKGLYQQRNDQIELVVGGYLDLDASRRPIPTSSSTMRPCRSRWWMARRSGW